MRRATGVAVRLTVALLCLGFAVGTAHPALAAQSRSSGTAADTFLLHSLGHGKAALLVCMTADMTLTPQSVWQGALNLSGVQLAAGDFDGQADEAVLLMPCGAKGRASSSSVPLPQAIAAPRPGASPRLALLYTAPTW